MHLAVHRGLVGDAAGELEELGRVDERERDARLTKNSSTAARSNDGEFDTSTTTCAPASPSPVSVLTPVFGAAATAS
ncbi:hypothetical protein [Nonomuraea jabiensis]|uniref:Uncharacterized protein n=1 Tax=Nonomuraea jabiensis TaxID=882448 RepID=A0A7W9GCM9_9ACTN|nr:hypothetical protein [Nonomuraea jabiensis]MBB5781322.1 hypothetical protein [Nonomuraea jabiensis]